MNGDYIAIIQAGGKGTRMLELTKDEIPKPLLYLNGKPIIEWQIKSLLFYGVRDFILIIGHLGELIQKYFEDGNKWGANISYIREKEPLGSAGALYYAKKIKNKNIIFIFGDIVFELDWKRFISFHESHDGLVTLLAHPNTHPYDSDLLITDKNSKIIGIDSKTNVRDYNYKNCVNSGLSIFRYELLDRLTSKKKIDYEMDLIKPLINNGKVYAYNTPEYVKDTGTPKRFFEACKEQKEGIWETKCLRNKQKVIFFDYNKINNVQKGLLHKKLKDKFVSKISNIVKKINNSDYLLVVLVNQFAIINCEYVAEKIRCKIETELGKRGAFINDLFFYKFQQHIKDDEEIIEPKLAADYKKTKIEMIVNAKEKYNIDLSGSWYVGSTDIDIMCGINAGLQTVLINDSKVRICDKYVVSPTLIVNDLFDAAEQILKLAIYKK